MAAFTLRGQWRRRQEHGRSAAVLAAAAVASLALTIAAVPLMTREEDPAKIKRVILDEARAAKDAARETSKLENVEAKEARQFVLDSMAKKAAESEAAEEAYREAERILAGQVQKRLMAEERRNRKMVAEDLKAEQEEKKRLAKRRRADVKEALKAEVQQVKIASRKGPGERQAESAPKALLSSRQRVAPGSEASVTRAKELLLVADAVFFEVDSTVVKSEGIDLLGKCFGVMQEISKLTHEAMTGRVRFQDAMAQRLQLLADHGMDRDSLQRCVEQEGRPRWSPKIKDVIKLFHQQGTHVYLVSGGFKNMMYAIAEKLSIPQENVFANEILFDDVGKYTGFDGSNPTCRSGGKSEVLRMMHRKHGYKAMIIFGDGATDLDARTRGPAAAFIGYGGVVDREKVRLGADWFIYSFREVVSVFRQRKP